MDRIDIVSCVCSVIQRKIGRVAAEIVLKL